MSLLELIARARVNFLVCLGMTTMRHTLVVFPQWFINKEFFMSSKERLDKLKEELKKLLEKIKKLEKEVKK